MHAVAPEEAEIDPMMQLTHAEAVELCSYIPAVQLEHTVAPEAE